MVHIFSTVSLIWQSKAACCFITEVVNFNWLHSLIFFLSMTFDISFMWHQFYESRSYLLWKWSAFSLWVKWISMYRISAELILQAFVRKFGRFLWSSSGLVIPHFFRSSVVCFSVNGLMLVSWVSCYAMSFQVFRMKNVLGGASI